MMKKAHVLRAWFVLLLFFTLQAAFTWPEDRQAQAPAPAPVLKDIPVPVIHVKGSHYEAGYQIGTQLKADILRDVADMKKSPDWKKVRAEAELFLKAGVDGFFIDQPAIGARARDAFLRRTAVP